MPTTLLTRNIWPAITKLCRGGRGHVAVAFFGKGSSRRLPLRPGSVLVVNASLMAVKTGQTCPADLMTLVRKGVEVHGANDLHAKVFAFPRALVVGSTNVSKHSATYWQEAAVLATAAPLIKSAREFVLSLTGEPMSLEELELLQRQYAPPKGGPATTGKSRKRPAPARHPLWIADLVHEKWTDEEHAQALRGRPVAKQRLSDYEHLDEFAWSGPQVHRLQRHDRVVQVMWSRRRTMLHPVGTIVHVRRWESGRGGAKAICYLAAPDGRRAISAGRVKKLLGADAKVVKWRGSLRHVRDPAVAHAIRQLWHPRS